MRKKELALEVIRRLKEEYPDADCTLDYDEAWKLLVSVRLAAQCTDARVNVVVEDLYAKFPDVNALADSRSFFPLPGALIICQNHLGLFHYIHPEVSSCMH